MRPVNYLNRDAVHIKSISLFLQQFSFPKNSVCINLNKTLNIIKRDYIITVQAMHNEDSQAQSLRPLF